MLFDARDPQGPAPLPHAAGEPPADPVADRIAELADLPLAPASLSLATGHTAVVHPAEPDRLLVRGPEGEVQLSIRFTPQGPVLSFSAAAIDLKAAGTVSVDCARLDVRARDGIELRTEGDLVQSAAGAARVDARRMSVEAHAGDLTLDATGDVDVHGARILLNS
jgi:hypothetical protein